MAGLPAIFAVKCVCSDSKQKCRTACTRSPTFEGGRVKQSNHAMDALKDGEYEKQSYIQDVQNLIQTNAVFTPEWSIPDWRWATDFIDDMMEHLDRMNDSLLECQECILTVARTAERVNTIYPQGAQQMELSEGDIRHLHYTIQQLDKWPPTDTAKQSFVCIKGAWFRHSEPKIRNAHPLPPKPTPIIIHPKWPPPSLPLWPAPPPPPTTSSLSMAMSTLWQSTGVYPISSTTRQMYSSNAPTRLPATKSSVTSKRKATTPKPSTNLSTQSNRSIMTSRHIMRDTRERTVGETTGNDSVGPSYGSGCTGPDHRCHHRPPTPMNYLKSYSDDFYEDHDIEDIYGREVSQNIDWLLQRTILEWELVLQHNRTLTLCHTDTSDHP